MSFYQVPARSLREAQELAYDLGRSGVMGTRWLLRIEEARAVIFGQERIHFERVYRQEYDHMTSDGLKHFGPGALAKTIATVQRIITREEDAKRRARRKRQQAEIDFILINGSYKHHH
jgi:hypothetical protein